MLLKNKKRRTRARIRSLGIQSPDQSIHILITKGMLYTLGPSPNELRVCPGVSSTPVTLAERFIS